MEEKKIIRNVKFHHEDSGFCRDTFVCNDCPGGKRYYNRDTVSGTWYTTQPSGGYYENGGIVKPEIVFNILDKNGNVVCTESNGTDSIFIPFDEYINKKIKECAKKYHLKTYEEFKEYLKNNEEFQAFNGYEENWMFSPDYKEKLNDIQTVENFAYLGIEFVIQKQDIKHTLCGKTYTEYSLKTVHLEDNYYCDYGIGYIF